MGYKDNGWSTRDKLDWDKVDASGPKPLDPGIYKLRIAKAEPKKTSSGKPGALLQHEVVSTHDGEVIDNNRKVFDNLTFEESAMFRPKQLALALDSDLPETNGFEDVQTFCHELLGKEVLAKLILRTYQGRTSSRIEAYLTEDEAADLSDDSDDDDDDMPTAKKAKKKKAKPAPAEDDDDDDDDEEPKRSRGVDAVAKKKKKAAPPPEDDDDDDDEDEDEEPAPKRRRSRK